MHLKVLMEEIAQRLQQDPVLMETFLADPIGLMEKELSQFVVPDHTVEYVLAGVKERLGIE